MEYNPHWTRVAFLTAVGAGMHAQRYLEIGVQDRTQCFDHVPAERKWGVDPAGGGATHVMTSDRFFAELPADETFDLVFVDGDHHHEQAARDVDNALRRLAPGGTIVMHDCYPQNRNYENLCLSGTVWRAFAHFRQDSQLEGFVGWFDCGVGVIKKRTNSSPIVLPSSLNELSYDDLMAHLDDWMRPRTFESLLAFVLGTEG